MKQCSICNQWIPDDYQQCPVCGADIEGNNQVEKNEGEQQSGKGTGCFYTIIILVLLLLCAGIGLYLYNNGIFSKTTSSGDDSLLLVNDSSMIEIGLPDSLTLDGTIYGNNVVTVDVKISTSGNIEGNYYEHSNKYDCPLIGHGDSKTGIITINIRDKDLSLELHPIGDGNYDAKWSTSTSEGTSYFYKASGLHLKLKEDEIPEFNPDSIFELTEIEDSIIPNKKNSVKLEGKLDGEISVLMNLYDLEGGKGEYYYLSEGEDKKIKLKCKCETNNQWRLLEVNDADEIKGVFVGKLEDGIFIGKYVSQDGQESAVTLFER